MGDDWVCADCGFRPVSKGRPPINDCPGCKGCFTWEPLTDPVQVGRPEA